MGMNAAVDWYWFVRDLDLEYGEESKKAYDFVANKLLPEIIAAGLPHEFIYDHILNTTNLVIPKDFVRANVRDVLKLAGFKEKAIPEKDTQSSTELKEALMKGANMSRRWH